MKRMNEWQRENSFGGFQYRWNYDEYQKSLQKKRKKNAAHGMRAFCVTTVFVLLLCTVSLGAVMTLAMVRGTVGVADVSDHTATDLSNPYQTYVDDAQPKVSETEPLAEPLETVPLPENNAVLSNNPQNDVTVTSDPEPADTVTVEAPNDTLLFTNKQPMEEIRVETPPAELVTTMTVNEIAASCTASTVTVCNQGVGGEAYGSGFFLSEDGYVVTNHHVIRRFPNCSVVTSAGTEYDAVLVASSPTEDMALLKIEITDAPAVKIGHSSALVIGDEVIAIGTPGSVEFAGTVTHGNVSGLNREVPITDLTETVIGHMNMIQISAVINPGNSGGPLFNTWGEVVGINTMKYTGDGYEGMGFSIPADTVIETLRMWMETDRAARTALETEDAEMTVETEIPVYEAEASDETVPVPVRQAVLLGIRAETVTADEAVLYRVPRGILVRFVEPDSYAARFGLESGDILLSVTQTFAEEPDTASVTTEFETYDVFDAWLTTLYEGDQYTCTLFRAGEEHTLEMHFSSSDVSVTEQTEDVAETTETAEPEQQTTVPETSIDPDPVISETE